MTKKELRKIYLEKRRSISEIEKNAASKLICDHFFNEIDLSKVFVLHIFLPITRNCEPDTWLIIDRLRREFPNIKIAIPKVNLATNAIRSFLFSQDVKVEMNSWEIPEPINAVEIPSTEIDAILIPLLTFDKAGHRVGYGKGFYDRFIGQCRPETLRVGISLFEGVSEIDDVTDFDQPLHCCITPSGLVQF